MFTRVFLFIDFQVIDAGNFTDYPIGFGLLMFFAVFFLFLDCIGFQTIGMKSIGNIAKYTCWRYG
jgi:hypothetical protein